MYFQTGSVVGRSYTEDGEFNNARVPIQELTSSGSNAKISSLISMYNYNLNMMRAATGLNEARDGSTPDQYALLGVQKLAALNSNTATRHVVQSGINITRRLCEAVSYRISDVLEYAPFAEDFARMIGRNNLTILNDIRTMHLHDFGVYVDLEPDEEEKQMLEQNIQLSLQANMIGLEDAIDIRAIRNITLANTLLKIRKFKKEKMDLEKQRMNIEMQTQSNIKSAQAASQGRMQEDEMKLKVEQQLAQIKSQAEMQKMQQQAQIDAEMLKMKYQYEMQLKQMDVANVQNRDTFKEDRKDKRTEIQATQQSELIAQRKQDLPPKDFEQKEAQNMGLEQIIQQQKLL